MINDINYFFYSRSIDVFDTSEIINTSRCILQRMTPELISNCELSSYFLVLTLRINSKLYSTCYQLRRRPFCHANPCQVHVVRLDYF